MKFSGREIELSRPQVMGVLNVTPDSFSDGGRYNTLDSALFQAESMAAAGASFIDVGGESTRPGAAEVSLAEELERVCPIVELINKNLDVVVSVDTSTPQVMIEAVGLGAGLINDVRALQRDGAMSAAIDLNVPVCLMHMQGVPATMQKNPQYDSVVDVVERYLLETANQLISSGFDSGQVIIDPGFGFGKTLSHNLQLLNAIDRFVQSGFPVLVGVSRKSMIGAILDKPVDERMIGSVAAATIAAYKGASILRVHDVKETVDAVSIVQALLEE
ncbi:dihydropteroate synthase [Alkalimarinus sediminis]|uniref:Dihydropteroate synthase n=1 Tax=Alkalimarinus sediminis TaxID=1632866 RepID=A0A9E8KPI4_9ALTE|nr:dihydropteroate synthase [Alkalimarinus sediminis]UZW74210.1 dihydropteroate synthase [Alkalimarinus sediminis]